MIKNDCCTFSVKVYEVFEVSVRWMINGNLMKLLSVWNFNDEVEECVVSSCSNAKYHWKINTKEIFYFLPLTNSSVTIKWRFLLIIISAIKSSNTINNFPLFSGFYSSADILHITKVLNRILFMKVPSGHPLTPFMRYRYFLSYGSLAYKAFFMDIWIMVYYVFASWSRPSNFSYSVRMANNLWQVWVMFLCVFSSKTIKVIRYTKFSIFMYSNEHTLLAYVLY